MVFSHHFKPSLVVLLYISPKAEFHLLSTQRTTMNVSKTLKSLNAATKSTVTFFNKTSHKVTTVWLNYEGKPVKYTELAPGKSYTQSTYVTHPWIVVEMDSGFFNLMQLNDWTV